MNKPIDTILVDDEFLALELLENFVSQVPSLRVVGRFSSAVKAIEFLSAKKTDLMFLDIQMPQLSGTSLLSILKDPPATIFTTAFSEYAVDAFALDAVDYLLKPFSFERFLQAVGKAQQRIEPKTKPGPSEDILSFRADGQLYRIQISDILFVESMKEYVRIHTLQKRYTTYVRLHQIESLLPPETFLKVHRSYIVSVKHVQSLSGNRLLIQNHEIPISRDLKTSITNRLFPH